MLCYLHFVAFGQCRTSIPEHPVWVKAFIIVSSQVYEQPSGLCCIMLIISHYVNYVTHLKTLFTSFFKSLWFDLFGNWKLITLFSGLFVTLPTAMTWVSLFPRSLAAQPGPASKLSSRPWTGCSSPTGAAAEHRIPLLWAVEEQQTHEYEL